MRGLITILVLAGVCGGVFYLGSLRNEQEDKPLLNVADDVAITVSVAKPMLEDIVRLVQAPGDVEAVLEVDVSAEIVAKIEEMPVEEGCVVKKGDLLCRLNDDNLRAQVESGEARVRQLEAAVQGAEADCEKAKRDLDRQVLLSEAEATSDLEFLNYQTGFKKADAVLKMRKEELVEAQAILKRGFDDLKKTIIEAPIDGVIAKLSAKQGEVVVTGTMNNPGTVIMTVADLSRMQVRARVDEVDVPLVHAGQKARVYLQAAHDLPVPARVVRVASKGSRVSGRDVVTFETILEVLSNDPRIKPGMTANVEVEVASSVGALTVPVESVVHRMRKELPDAVVAEFDKRQDDLDLSDRARLAQYIKVVYVMKGEVAEVRLIKPGIADTRRVELVEGVLAEDTVIVGPYRSLDQLEDGKKVALADDEMPAVDEKPADEDEALADGKGDGDDGDDSGDDGEEEKEKAAQDKDEDDDVMASGQKP